MLQFSDEYFMQETRMDFTISHTMKCAWAAQLEVLSEVIDICQKYGIQYYAFWGTLLGAVRHQGFIPWDDDIDICMMREDYISFLKIVKREIPSEYCVLNVYNEEGYENTFTRITNSHSIDLSESHLRLYHGCPFVVGVDIFPLDRIPVSKELTHLQGDIADMIAKMISLVNYASNQQDVSVTEMVKQSVEEGIETIEETLGIQIDHSKVQLNQLRQLFDRTAMLGNAENGKYLTSYPEYVSGKGFLFEEDWFEKNAMQQMKFENIWVSVPMEWDKVLHTLFGDYMTPVRECADHEYPFYREQLQMLHSRGLWMDVTE